MPKLSNSCRLPYQIYNEDCFETFKRIPNESIDLVLCDPPYGTTACKWDSIIPLEPMWLELKRVTYRKSPIVLLSSQPFTSKLVMSCLSNYSHSWIWKKSNVGGFLNANRQPLKRHEEVLVFWRSQGIYNPIKTKGIPYSCTRAAAGLTTQDQSVAGWKTENKTGERYPTSVLDIKSETGYHPTQKPVALMEYLIKTYSNEGDTVLDFAMGSGTTGVACMNLGRKFIGCDSDKEHGYFEIAKNRISEAYRMKAGQNA